MAKCALQLYFTDRLGNALNQATVTVKTADTDTNVSTWTDRAGTITGDNPVLTDSSGEILVYVTPGRYDITATKNGSTQTIPDYLVVDESVAGQINVKSYGAKGDGVTDDTTAIQNSADALGDAGGGTLFFPRGTYLKGPTFITDSNIHVKGEGIGATILKLKDSALADQWGCMSFGIQSNKSTSVAITNCSIRDLTVNGNKANQLQGTSASNGVNFGIYVATVAGFTADHVKTYDCDGYGVGLVGTDLAGRSDFTIKNLETYNNNYDGLDIKGGTTNIPMRIALENVYSHDNGPGVISGRDAVGLDLRGQYISVKNCYVSDNDDTGIRVRADHCFEAVIEGCTAFSNGGDGFRVDGAAANKSYKFTACKSIDNGTAGYRIDRGPTDLVSCYASGNVTNVSQLTNASVLKIIGGKYTTATGDGIDVTIAGSKLIVSGAEVNANTGFGIDFNGGTLCIDGALVYNNSVTGTGQGIRINGTNSCSFWSITNSQIFDDQGGSATQDHAIGFAASPAAGVLMNNYINGHVTGAITGTVPVGTKARNNIGFPTEAAGTATVLNGTTSIVVTHGINGTPTFVVAMPNESVASAAEWWVDTIGASQFSIKVDSDPGTDVTFMWRAERNL